MFMVHDYFPVLLRPFLMSKIVLLLSWYRMSSFMLHPCALMNKIVHRTLVILSLSPTSSDSVELCIFNLCFDKMLCIVPSPKVITTPVYDLKSGCRSKLAPTYHLMMCKLSALRVNTSFHLQFTYCMYWINFASH